MQSKLVNYVLNSTRRRALLMDGYVGLSLAQKTVYQSMMDTIAQVKAELALHDRYNKDFLTIFADLTIEPETFGGQVIQEGDGIPQLTGRAVKDRHDLQALLDPKPGHKRTTVPLSTTQLLIERSPQPQMPVVSAMIGPFSLASRLFGQQEILKLVDHDPVLLTDLLKSINRFLVRYANAFRMVEADGLIIFEEDAGSLSSDGIELYSLPFLKQILETVQNDQFSVIISCSQISVDHLPAILEAKARGYQFGPGMDLSAALARVPDDTLILGNLDPVSLFQQGTPQQVADQTAHLLGQTVTHPNFVISAAGSLHPSVPLANLDAFYETLARFNAGR